MQIDIRHNQIIGFDRNNKRKVHKPLSTIFSEIELLSDGRIIVIEDYYKFKYKDYSNLYCLNRNIEIDWFLQFPDDGPDKFDYYVGFTSIVDKVYANTFGCFRVEIDLINGKILNAEFTK